ncbi:unnamed protein product [Blepharisma stoltei]|uniref:Uncharacterized protein n=1 Tax=Blepharisma stoltei TaxID=1481888 RepID=A0AAU9IPI8_9CILI|nr:unnamed protein product [Blepharisma stoltei]
MDSSEEENPFDDIQKFEKKLKNQRGEVLDRSSSSEEEEEFKEIPSSNYSNENVRLQNKCQLLIQQVVDKEREIDSLRQALGYAKPEPEEAEIASGDYRDKKLMELAKKNRTLQVALESEKNRAARAMEEVNKLREQLLKTQTTKGWKHDAPPQPPEENFKQKYLALDKQYQEIKQKYHNTKDELKKAIRIIEREVGEFESLDQLSKSETWRGRAQQIDTLKSKLNDLKRQASTRGKADEISSATVTSFRSEAGGAEERRREIQNLNEQLNKALEELDSWKKKAQGSSSRKAAVEKELKESKEKHKSHIKTLLEKSENDDMLIASLKEELDRVRKSKGIVVKQEPASQQKEIEELNWQLVNLHKLVSDLQEEVKEKDGILELYKNFKGDEGEEEVENEIEYKERIRDLESEVLNLRIQLDKKNAGSEDTKIIKDLSSQNARLRSKVNELTEEVSKFKNK